MRPQKAKHDWSRAALAGALTMLLASLHPGATAPLAQQQPTPNTQKPAPEGQKPVPEGQKPVPEGQKPAPETQKPTPPPAANAAPPAKPLVPLAASTLATHPDTYYGESVTITAPVDQSVGTMAFSLNQDPAKNAGKDILVLAPRLNSPVDPKAYVTVIGEVVKMDAAEIGKKKEYAGALSPEVAAKFQGKPVVLATAVITSGGIDLAKRLPPPLTPQEEAFQKVMKKVGPAFAELRKGADGSNVEMTKTNAVILKQMFTETEAFWKTKGKADAIGWAQDARKMSESIEKTVAAAKWDEIKATAGNVGKTCQSCHGLYRERFDDGQFRIKLGG
jgi:cytochrome c556